MAADLGSVGLEMGIAVAIGCYGGMWLDARYDQDPLFLMLGMGAGFGAAFKAIYRTATKARKAMGAGEASNTEANRDGNTSS